MHEYEAEIVSLIDGDTFRANIDLGFGLWIRNEPFRLYGVDTPESNSADMFEREMAHAATQCAEQWRLHWQKVGAQFVVYTFKKPGKRDKRGKYRYLAILRVKHAGDNPGLLSLTLADHLTTAQLCVEYDGGRKPDWPTLARRWKDR